MSSKRWGSLSAYCARLASISLSSASSASNCCSFAVRSACSGQHHGGSKFECGDHADTSRTSALVWHAFAAHLRGGVRALAYAEALMGVLTGIKQCLHAAYMRHCEGFHETSGWSSKLGTRQLHPAAGMQLQSWDDVDPTVSSRPVVAAASCCRSACCSCAAISICCSSRRMLLSNCKPANMF